MAQFTIELGRPRVAHTSRMQSTLAAIRALGERCKDRMHWASSLTAEDADALLTAEARSRRLQHMPAWPEEWEHPDMQARLLPAAAELRAAQLADDNIGPLLRWIEEGVTDETLPLVARRALVSKAANYTVVGDLLYHVPTVPIFEDALALQLVIPEALRPALVRETHEHVLGAHVGVAKLYGLLQRRYFWEGMWRDAAELVARCPACKQAKLRLRRDPRHRRAVLADYPFQRVHIDLWDAQVVSAAGYRYVLTVVDAHTRWCELIPLRDKRAETVARAFFQGVICRHGTPAIVTSDQGTEFMAVFDQLMRLYGIQRAVTAPYRPQTNGIAERIHSFLRSALSIMVEEDHTAWDQRVEAVAFAYRSAPLEGTTFSPFYLLHGREPTLPGQLTATPPAVIDDDPTGLVEELRDRLGRAYALLRLQRQRILERRAGHTRTRPAAAEHAVGDRVLVWRPRVLGGQSAKLSYRWLGPYEVVEAAHPIYMLRDLATGKKRQAHADHVRADGLRQHRPSGRQPDYPAAEAVGPPPGTDRLTEGQMAIVAIPGDPEPWRLVQAIADSAPGGLARVHVFVRQQAQADTAAARWRPAYFDPTTGQDVARDVATGRLEAYVRQIPLSTVVVYPVKLTGAGRIRQTDLAQLARSPAARWEHLQPRGPRQPDPAVIGARIVKDFPDGSFEGRVMRLIPAEDDEDDQELYYHVRYTDGDEEDFTLAELRPLLAAHAESTFR